jgi:hypothetical protein
MSLDNILRIIYESNGKVFAPQELKKVYNLYEGKGVLDIIETFKANCDQIKANMIDKLEYETELSEMDDSMSKFNNRKSCEMLNNSYKIVNERIIKLKKFEFDFANLILILKNYLVAQELIYKLLFGNVYKENNNSEVIFLLF